MLPPVQEDGSYLAPRWSPGYLPLPATDHAATWLYRWVQHAATHPRSPASVAVEGSPQQRVGQPLQASVSITNRLDVDLPYVLSGWGTSPSSLDTGLLIAFDVDGAVSRQDTDGEPLLAEVAPNSTVALELADHFDVVQPGVHSVWVYVRLSAGDSRAYAGPVEGHAETPDQLVRLWSYKAVPPTAVSVESWGTVKRERQ